MRTPLRGLLSRAVDLLPVGPPEAARRAAEFTIVAVARGEDGSTVRAIVRGLDCTDWPRSRSSTGPSS
jgi:hypothetical protein